MQATSGNPADQNPGFGQAGPVGGHASGDGAAPTRFEAFGLPEPLLRAITDLGFDYCTPIQAETLPHALSNYDVTGQAQTGTGKTAAFLIALITHQLEFPLETAHPPGTPRALIIAPTRELALQIAADAEGLARHARLRVANVVGGMDFERQRRELEKGTVDILVGTPGRLIDWVTRGVVNLRQVEQLVIDEGDRMLSMGFIPDVRRIIRQTPPRERRQTLLFSATFTDDVLRLAHQWTLEPEHVAIEPEQVAVDTVEQHFYLVTARERFHLLYNLIQRDKPERLLVFANRRDTTRILCDRLHRRGIGVEMLSGEVPQKKRLRTLGAFKSGQVPVLIATDVAGRGLHVEAISHVINYDLPEDPEDYVHRIGRTGRAGASGVSISFVSENGAFELPEIERLVGTTIECEQPDAELLETPPKGTPRKREASSGQRGKQRPRGGGNRR